MTLKAYGREIGKSKRNLHKTFLEKMYFKDDFMMVLCMCVCLNLMLDHVGRQIASSPLYKYFPARLCHINRLCRLSDGRCAFKPPWPVR